MAKLSNRASSLALPLDSLLPAVPARAVRHLPSTRGAIRAGACLLSAPENARHHGGKQEYAGIPSSLDLLVSTQDQHQGSKAGNFTQQLYFLPEFLMFEGGARRAKARESHTAPGEPRPGLPHFRGFSYLEMTGPGFLLLFKFKTRVAWGSNPEHRAANTAPGVRTPNTRR